MFEAKRDIIVQAIKMFDPKGILLHVRITSDEMEDFFYFDYASYVVAYPLTHALRRDQQLLNALLEV